MGGYEHHTKPEIIAFLEGAHMEAMQRAIDLVSGLKNDVSKQILGRYLEPFQYQTMLVTFTESSNFFELRSPIDGHYLDTLDIVEQCGEKLRPSEVNMQFLAYKMREAMRTCTADKTGAHMPFYTQELAEYSQEQQAYICAARCARLSYLNFDGKSEPEKDLILANKLVREGHWSPFEHVAFASFSNMAFANFRGWRSLRSRIQEGRYIPLEFGE
jgi:hypothetical protein